MNSNFDILIQYLPVLLPVIIVELALAITALVHVLRHPHYKFGNKLMWIFAVVLIQFAGPIIYFLFGRGEE